MVLRKIGNAFLAVVLAVSPLSLAACQTAERVVHIANTPLAGGVIMDERFLAFAEVLYNVPAQAYRAIRQNQQLPAAVRSETRRIARPTLVLMGRTLRALRQAYRVGDAASFGDKLTELRRLREVIQPLIPGLAPPPAVPTPQP